MPCEFFMPCRRVLRLTRLPWGRILLYLIKYIFTSDQECKQFEKSKRKTTVLSCCWCRFEKPTSASLSVYREPSFGHGRLRILNQTHAFWSWHRNNDSDCILADSLWLQSLSVSRQCTQFQQDQASLPLVSVNLNDELWLNPSSPSNLYLASTPIFYTTCIILV